MHDVGHTEFPTPLFIIGAGVMGRGVAQNAATHGVRAVLVDCERVALDSALTEIHNGLRFSALFGKASGDAGLLMDRIEVCTDLERLNGAEYVVENITEDWALKQALYRSLDRICPPSCVFAANTSALSITKIGALVSAPERVIGVHFMNPVPMTKTVEVIRGFHTSEQSLRKTEAMLTSLGKDWVLVNDSPGFISNRVLMLTINEAIFLLQERVAENPESVDRVFKSCFGHKMGPLETADLIGLDTILRSLEVLLESYSDPKFRPCPLLKKMVDAGLHGRKSHRGFYEYPGGR